MSKIILITLYEHDYIGTRVLASHLIKNGHEAHVLHFKLGYWAKFTDAVENHLGYQVVSRGEVRRNCQDVNPVTEKEYALLGKKLREYDADIIGISARSLHDGMIPHLMQTIKASAPDKLIVAGGFGPTLNVLHYLQNGVDAVIRGDGEDPLAELAHAVEKGDDWRNIANISYLADDEVVDNPLRPQSKDLDKYPAPLYGDEHFSWIDHNTLTNNEDYAIKSSVYVTLLGRGCIGKCTYCCGGQWYGQYRKYNNKVFKRRNRSIDSVFQELNAIRPKFKYIGFNDELYAAPDAFIKRFFERYKKEIDLPFFIYMSYEKMLHNDDLFNLVIDAGWQSTGIGAQSGSERLCHDMYARTNKNSDYIAYARKLFDNNVQTLVHIIGGNCYETDDDLALTLDFIKELPFSITDPAKNNIYIFRLKPHPKTPILELAPRVLSDPMPAREWLYRAALCHCRRIMDDDSLSEIRSSKFYQEQPDALLALYRYLLAKKQREYFAELAQANEGKEVIFYGAGELYAANRHLFKSCKPSAILVDKGYIKGNEDTAGAPLIEAYRIGELNPDAPIIIFSKLASMVQRNLERRHGIAKERIHTCTTLMPPQGQRF